MTENSKLSLRAFEFDVLQCMGYLFLCRIFRVQAFSIDPLSRHVKRVDVALCGSCELNGKLNTPDVVVCYVRDVGFFWEWSAVHVVPQIDRSQIVVCVCVGRSRRFNHEQRITDSRIKCWIVSINSLFEY